MAATELDRDVARPAPPSAGRLVKVSRLLRQYSFGFALVLTVVLLIVNLISTPSFSWEHQLANFAPLAIAAMASTPAIISGGGGFDLSISPLMVLTSALLAVWLIPAGLGGLIAIPILLVVGAAIGLANGLFIIGRRVAPVVVTLSTYFILIGVNLRLLPAPITIQGSWVSDLAGTIGPFPGALFTIGAPLLIWILLGRLPFRRTLYLVGSDDATAYSSGVNVAGIRIAAYALGGMFAAIGGLAIVAVDSSASASLSTTYALQAIAAVALGGTSLWGGRGGIGGSLLGAASLYLLGNVLILAQVNPSWLQVVYGGMLVLAVVLVSFSTERKETS